MTAIDKKIANYLDVLNDNQKKAVLSVVKAFAEENTQNEYSDEFKAELDDRYEEYLNGTKLISEKEANKRVTNIIKGKAR